MKRIITTLITSVLCLSLFGQGTAQISGSVADVHGNPIAGSAVYLLATDSSIIKTNLTSKDGNFLFEGISAGAYRLKASAQGYTEMVSELLTLSAGQNLMAGTLKVEPITKSLKAVVVSSKKPMFEVKADKTIMNVDAAISNTGAYALEVLEKAPGVSVDKDGNISLKGKQGVIILIDGKQTYLSGNELANYLRNMPASNLEQVEIMTNPSAKYDAAGNSGIINIKTKKQKQRGFNGSANVAYGQGFYHRLNNSLSLNYRTGKVNMVATLSANTRKSRRLLEINRKYLSPSGNVNAEFEQLSRDERENENFNAKVGMDYSVTRRTTLGFVVTGYTVPSRKRGSNTSYLKDGLNNVDSIVYSLNGEDGSWKHLAANVNFRHQFDSAGQELTADVDYLTYTADNNQMFSNDVYNADWVKRYGDQLFGELPSQIDIYTAKIDYTKPLAKALKLEAGYKFSGVSTDNIAD